MTYEEDFECIIRDVISTFSWGAKFDVIHSSLLSFLFPWGGGDGPPAPSNDAPVHHESDTNLINEFISAYSDIL